MRNYNFCASEYKVCERYQLAEDAENGAVPTAEQLPVSTRIHEGCDSDRRPSCR